MKAFTKFDYPTAEATTFKAYRQPNSPPPSNKHHYQQVMRQQSQNERDRGQANQHRKMQHQNQQNQAKLREKIERKKRELEQLQLLEEQAIEEERIAAEMAKTKEEEDRVTRLQLEQKTRENEVNAQGRFREALRRLEVEKEENRLQERQAEMRRKVCQEVERDERQRAAQFQAKYSAWQEEERERAREQEKKADEAYCLGLGRFGTGKNVDYSKTCIHNPRMVYKHGEEDNAVTAIERGQTEEQRQQTMTRLRQSKQQEQRRRSLQRGEKATQKIEMAREYQQYERDTQNEQVKYNIERIEEGKRHQHVGLKPLTLQQIQMNKRLRAEGEFEGMFMGPQVELQQHNRSAHNYTIMQNRISRATEQTHQPPSARSESFAVFDPKSTFNPQNYAFETASVEEEEDSDLVPREVVAQPIQSHQQAKRPMAETRAEEPGNRGGDLDYSESQEDESNY